MRIQQIAAALAAVATSATAETLYTNTWSNTAGIGTVKNWGDAANWSAVYEPGVTPPASTVPTSESLVKILRNADITLQSGDDYHTGSARFLAGGIWNNTLNLEIPAGARLSLDGTENSTTIGVAGIWPNRATNNKVKIDINGGELVCGQSMLDMRTSMQTYGSTGYNWILIRNGGRMSVTNGFVRLWGDSPNGTGPCTNIIDVLAGTTLALSGNGRITFGSSSDTHYNMPWGSGGNYSGGGWVNVKGGKIEVKDSTTSFPIVMNGHRNCETGDHLDVTDGGEIDLGGQYLLFSATMTNMTAAVSVSGGSVITNGGISVQYGSSEYGKCLLDINGGTVYAEAFAFGGAVSGNNSGRLAIRIHGGDSTFSFLKWAGIAGTFWNMDGDKPSIPPTFMDLRLKAHTARDAGFAIRPIRTRTTSWDASEKYVHGFYRLSPDGGFQLVHTNSFDLLCRKKDSGGNYQFSYDYGGLIGEEMWATNCALVSENSALNAYVEGTSAYVFQVSLKDGAMLTDGEALAQPKPRAWLQLPTFAARQVNSNRTERVSVRLDLAAPEGGSLDLDGVVAKMREEGGQDAYADDSVAGYNVRVDLPMDELAAGTTDDKVIMDFVSCDLYPQAFGARPMTTNALIRAATCEVVPRIRSTRIIVR